MADTSYYVTIDKDFPPAPGIDNKDCTVVFTYHGGSSSHPYSGKIIAWTSARVVKIESRVMNIEAAWKGANGGTLTIRKARHGDITRGITDFVKE
jgi:hypothetical protein